MTFQQAIKKFNETKCSIALKQRFDDVYNHWKDYQGNSRIEREARRKNLERFLLNYL